MRIIFILFFITNLALTIVTSILLPSHAPIYLSEGSMASGSTSNSLSTLIYIFMEIIMFLMIYYSPKLMFALPPRWYNLPNTDYWLKEENKPRVLSMISSMMWEFGSVVFLFLLVVGILSMMANLPDSVQHDETKFVIVFALFLLYVIVWCIKFFKAFRLPKK